MDPLLNPFTPGAGSRPRALIGRDPILSKATLAMRRCLARRPMRSLLVTGLRGVGKTVLLNEFATIAKSVGFSVINVEVPEPERPGRKQPQRSDFGAYLLPRIRSVLADFDRGRVVVEAVRHAMRTITSFSLRMSPDGTVVPAVDLDLVRGLADSGDLDYDLTAVLVSLGEAARAKDTGVFIAIDEMQYLTIRELSALIAALHRVAQLELPLMVIGAGLPHLLAMAGAAKSYAERLFEYPRIGSLPEEEAMEALRDPARDAGVAFTDAALSHIVAKTQGYPYFLQEYGSKAWDEAHGTLIDEEIVRTIEPLVQADLDANFFAVRNERLSPRERAYVVALASLGPGPHRSGGVAAAMKSTSDRVGTVRESLVAKGMIFGPEYGETEFTVPLFWEYAQRKLRPTDAGIDVTRIRRKA